ncbi:hypothetical protein K7711_01690 [Nocardia sp. CA2R105]|uniref:hypothetical protein n=1 Tax=Nocardia coffeae TaxID=2873381 RepID=UPI001CA65298|nr:hypothetical protein [Nocardia coffeae]MBY8855182.1 hypothetical protein [Nocardia coffeae]
MSPVSRGRKGKENKRGEVRRGGADVVENDDLGVAEMMAEVDARITEFEQVDEPVDGEYLAAGLLAVGYGESADYLDVFVRLFVDRAEELATPGALAFLRCVTALIAEPSRNVAQEAADRLAAAGVVPPAWVPELDEPLTAGEFVRWPDVDGTGATLFGSFARAGRTDGFLIFVDDENCGAAYDLAPFVGEGLTESRRLTDEQEPADEELMTAGEFRWHVHAALDARALHDRAAREAGVELEEPEEDDAIPHEVAEVVVRARLQILPVAAEPLPIHVHPEFEAGVV